ncbi:MAG: HAMP domain-containing sensor histidine kinase, partial [Acidobacteriota bacterium]
MRWAHQLWDAESDRTRLEVAEELDALVADLARELMGWNLDVQSASIGDPSSPTNPRPQWRRQSALASLVDEVYLRVPGTSGEVPGTSKEVPGTSGDAAGEVPGTSGDAWYAVPTLGPVDAVDPPSFAAEVATWAGDAAVSGLLPRSIASGQFVLSARVSFDGAVDLRTTPVNLLALGPVLWMTIDRDVLGRWIEASAAEHWRGHLEHLDYQVTAAAGGGGGGGEGGGEMLFSSRPSPSPDPPSGLGHLYADLDLRHALGETLALRAGECADDPTCFGDAGGVPDSGDVGAAEVLLDALRSADPNAVPAGAAVETAVFVSIPNADERWRVDVWIHRHALDPQLRELWTRNLAIGLAALGVLGVAVALLMALTLQSQRLARAQFDFVTGVTHELRTPLSVLRSASANLADGVVTEPAQVSRYGQVMTKEVRRLGDLVERILGFTRPDDADGPGEAAVGPGVERVLERLGEEIAERGAEVEVRVAAGLPPVAARPWALESLLHNLVGNALKYGGGRVALEASPTRWKRRPAVEITVRDWGPGLGRG